MYINKARYEVITVGEATVDAFMRIKSWKGKGESDDDNHAFCIKLGEKIDVDKYVFSMGGNATNVAVGLSRLGIKTGLCTEIGDDEFSIIIRNSLAKEQVERLLVKQRTNSPSSFSVIMNFKDDRTVFVEDVEREHDFDFADVTAPFVYLTSLGREWKKAYHTTLDFVEEHKSTLAFNPGSRQLREGKDVVLQVLEKTKMLFINRDEAEHLLFEKTTDQRNEQYMRDLMKQLQSLGPKVVILTDGKYGSFVLTEDESFYKHDAGNGKIVERTGAGDAYTTGFIAATLGGKSIEEAMEWGTKNAMSVVSKIGAEAGLLKKEEMESGHKAESLKDIVEDTDLLYPAPVE